MAFRDLISSLNTPTSRAGSVVATAERRDSLENPSIPLSSPQAWALISGQTTTDSGTNVNEWSALRTMAVWRAVHLISGTIAQFPLRVWEGRRGVASDRKPVDTPWIDNPNSEITWLELMETSIAHILLWGNAYWLPVWSNNGDQVVNIWTIAPWSVDPTRLPSPRVGVPGPKVYNVHTGPGMQMTDGQVLHIPGLGYDGIRGLSPIAYAREAIGIGVAAEQFGARLFGSGSLMAGILKTSEKLTNDQADVLKARWRDKVTGLSKAHEAVVMDSGMSWQAIGIPPEQAQFLQTRQFSVEEICRLYGVPPHLMMLVEKTTTWGAGIAEQSLGFVRYTLSGWTARFEQRITKRLCQPGQYAEFDTSQLLKGDTAARYSSYANAITAGWFSPADARRAEGMTVDDPALEKFLTPGAVPPPPLTAPREPKGV